MRELNINEINQVNGGNQVNVAWAILGYIGGNIANNLGSVLTGLGGNGLVGTGGQMNSSRRSNMFSLTGPHNVIEAPDKRSL